jgi:hypothetical protein
MAVFKSPAQYTDSTGSAGESLAIVRLSRPVGGNYKRPLFLPTPLGGKYPTVDFIVDLLGPDSKPQGTFFFAQVKATAVAVDTAARLNINIDLAKFNALAAMPLPTYLIGVDTLAERTFIVSAGKREKTGLSSMTKKHDLKEDDVRVQLYKEVLENWKVNRALLLKLKSHFKNVR